MCINYLLFSRVMYGDERKLFENQIVSKKNKPLDDDEPISKKKQKKHRKNQNKTINHQNIINAHEQKINKSEQPQNQNSPLNQKKKSQQSEKIFQSVRSILPNHKPQTILRILESHNYNQMEALNQLMEIPEDACQNSLMDEFFDAPTKPPDKVEETWSSKEMGTKILQDICQNEEEIDKTEFEELFEEIASIIKKDQEERGLPLIQFNEFMDSYELTKKMLLSENQDIHLDENDPLVVQTEQFLEDLIKQKVSKQKQMQENFPTLSSTNTSISVNYQEKNGKNYFEQIQDGYKQEKKKEQYFVPSKIPTQFIQSEKDKARNIYTFSIDENEEVDVRQLSKDYPGLSIDKLKFVFSRLHDFNLCRSFLDKYYTDQKDIGQKIEKPKPKIVPKMNGFHEKKVSLNDKILKIDSSYNDVSLEEIRDELDHLFKRRQVFRMTKGKTTNKAYKKQFDRLASRDDPTIQKLSEIARYKLVQEMAQSHPQSLDLHGYREEEIDDLFDQISDMIKREFKAANSLIKTKTAGNEVYCIIRAGTGKGLHSKHGKSILKPAVVDWSNRRGYRNVENEDNIEVYIRVR